MELTADFKPAGLVRSLSESQPSGALATLMAGSGDPYCSLINVASAPDGSPILLISRLAVHTKNILADPRVSVMLDERSAGDPLEGARIMLAGIAEEASGDRCLLSFAAVILLRILRQRCSPTSRISHSFASRRRASSGCRIWTHHRSRTARFSDRSQRTRMHLIEAEPDIVAHMNADHTDDDESLRDETSGR